MHPLRVVFGKKKAGSYLFPEIKMSKTHKSKNIGDLEQVVKIKEQLSMINKSPFSFESTQNL